MPSDDTMKDCMIEGVSTIPDECREVGYEIGTYPKRKAIIGGMIEDIVSASGDRRGNV